MIAIKEDDLSHEPLADPVWRESFFFGFFDPDQSIGMYTSMGERPFKNRAGSILTVWGKKGVFVDNYIFDSLKRTDRTHRTQGLMYECIEPLEQWRLTFSGTLKAYPEDVLRLNPEDLSIEAAARRNRKKIEMDLTWEAICPAHAYEPNPGFFDVHLEQHGHVKGWIKIGDESIEVQGVSIRDKSHGPRNWGADKGWIWIPSFIKDPDLPLVAAARAKHWDGEVDEVGYLYDRKKDRFEMIKEFKENVEREGGEPNGTPLKCSFELIGEEGTSFSLKGKMLKVVPTVLMFKGATGEAAGKTCWIDRCLVEYDFGRGHVEYGEVELGNMINLKGN